MIDRSFQKMSGGPLAGSSKSGFGPEGGGDGGDGRDDPGRTESAPGFAMDFAGGRFPDGAMGGAGNKEGALEAAGVAVSIGAAVPLSAGRAGAEEAVAVGTGKV